MRQRKYADFTLYKVDFDNVYMMNKTHPGLIVYHPRDCVYFLIPATSKVNKVNEANPHHIHEYKKGKYLDFSKAEMVYDTDRKIKHAWKERGSKVIFNDDEKEAIINAMEKYYQVIFEDKREKLDVSRQIIQFTEPVIENYSVAGTRAVSAFLIRTENDPNTYGQIYHMKLKNATGQHADKMPQYFSRANILISDVKIVSEREFEQQSKTPEMKPISR